MGLRAKFNLVILAAFAVGFLIAAVVLNRVANDTARDQVLQNARIMMTAADAFRNYTANDLVRLLPSERDGKFVAETVPAYGAQTTFKQLQDAFSGFSYREAALNPTNPANRARDLGGRSHQSFPRERGSAGARDRARYADGTIAPHGPAAFGADGGMPDLSQRAVRRAAGLDAHLRHDQRIWLEAARDDRCANPDRAHGGCAQGRARCLCEGPDHPGRHLRDRLYRDEPAAALRDRRAGQAALGHGGGGESRPEGRGALHQTRQGRDLGAVGGLQPHAGKPQAGVRDDRMTFRRQLSVQPRRGMRANI